MLYSYSMGALTSPCLIPVDTSNIERTLAALVVWLHGTLSTLMRLSCCWRDVWWSVEAESCVPVLQVVFVCSAHQVQYSVFVNVTWTDFSVCSDCWIPRWWSVGGINNLRKMREAFCGCYNFWWGIQMASYPHIAIEAFWFDIRVCCQGIRWGCRFWGGNAPGTCISVAIGWGAWGKVCKQRSLLCICEKMVKDGFECLIWVSELYFLCTVLL